MDLPAIEYNAEEQYYALTEIYLKFQLPMAAACAAARADLSDGGSPERLDLIVEAA